MTKGVGSLMWALVICGGCLATLPTPMVPAQAEFWLFSEMETLPEEETSLNIEVDIQESCAIKVSWDSGGSEGNTTLTCTQDGDTPIEFLDPVSPFNLTSLYPDTEYEICIEISEDDNSLNECTKVNTTDQGPTPPSNLKATSGRRRVSLSWEAPDTYCNLYGYHIRYTGKVLWNEDFCNGTKDELSNAAASNLTSLVPYTNYSVCIRAWTEDSKSKEFFGDDACTDIQTQEDTPGPPLEVTASAISSSKLEVSWKQPNQLNGQLVGYVVSWGEKETNTTQDTMILEGLQPCTTYDITVRAQTGAGAGEGVQVSGETHPAAPPAPGELTVGYLSPHEVSLTWIAPATPCPISYYWIKYTGKVLWSDEITEGSKKVPGNETSANLSSLVPYTSYEVHVNASTGDLHGKEEHHIFTTDADVPGAPVGLRKVKDESETAMVVEWKPPETLNGVLLGYTVFWSPVGKDKKQSSIVTNETQATLGNLVTCVTYQVSVRAATSAGEGSRIKNLFQTEPRDPPPPSEAKCNATSSTSIAVQWSPPENYACKVSGYMGSYSGSVLWSNETEKGVINSQTGTDYEAESLVPWSEYTFCIKTFVGDKSGTNACCCSSCTDPAIPSAPTGLQKVRDEDETSMVVEWTPPEEKNGVLLGYEVEWSLNDKDEGNFKTSITTPETQATLSGLVRCRSYHVSVQASTDAGVGPGTFKNMRTNPTEPPPHPSETRCKNTSSTSVFVQWSPPVDYACWISSYTGSYSGRVLWSNEMDKGVISSQTGTSYEAKGLVPWSDYTFCIKTIAGNKNSTGEDCCSSRTDSASPSMPYNVTAQVTGSWSIRVTWCAPKEINGENLTYVVTLDSNQLFHVENKTSCDIYDLTPSTLYNVYVQAANNHHISKAVFVSVTTDLDVVAIVVGVIVPLVVIAVVGGLAFRYRRKLRQYFDSRPAQRARPSTDSLSLDDRLYGRPLTKTQLREHIKVLENADGALSREFEYLRQKSYEGDVSTAKLNKNLRKNRFTNILPYEETRVLLTPLNETQESDYINANFVNKQGKDRAFIAAQGPKGNTVGDFWRMLWEHQVFDVVMLTNLYENGKEKCWQYWPGEGQLPIVVDGIVVRTHGYEAYGDFIVRILHIQKGEHHRRVKQYHFTAWPDFGVPDQEHKLLDFVFHVRNSWNSKASKRLVVHCSAGVGRTGTFIALWKMIDSIKENGDNAMNIYDTVLDMRNSRVLMVQSKLQYLFLHKCIYMYVMHRDRWDSLQKNEELHYENMGFVPEEPIYEYAARFSSDDSVYEQIEFGSQESADVHL